MELLERFAAGDLDAFEELFRQHQKAIYAWTVRIVRDPGIAEDLTVETFWRIYRARAQFRPTGSFCAWARRIATNAALDHLLAGKRRSEVALSDDLSGPADIDPAVLRETRDRIKKAFAELPAKYRLVATLALVQEEPYETIAEATGISAGLVKMRVFRAVRILRKKLSSLVIQPGA
jgi:RNA polymerase sigma-70 factor (ECF subfamily)